jgi:hypothetical protein
MIKIIGDNYRIYGLIIVKFTKKSIMLYYGLSNATFETINHVSAHAFIGVQANTELYACIHQNIIITLLNGSLNR